MGVQVFTPEELPAVPGVEVTVEPDDGRVIEEPDGRRYVTPPSVRLNAFYGDSHPGLPEQFEVTWECNFPTVAELVELINATGALARRRWEDIEPRDITG